MPSSEQLSPIGRGLLNRRNFLRNTGAALGGFGLAGLLAQGMSPWAAARLGCALMRTAGASAALE